MEQVERAAETAAAGQLVNAAAELEQAIADEAGERFAEIGDVLIEFAAGLHNELGGGGRRGSAHVGDEIGDSEIGFVAYAGDYGNLRSEDGARDFFFIEGPEIFEGAAAAGENQNVDHLPAIEELQRANDFGGGAIALDAHGIDGEVHIAEAAAQDAHHVADGGSAGRSDQADAAGEKRQRLLAAGGEEAFGFEALLELLEGELQSTESDRFDVLDIDLVFAARFVDADGAAHGDVQAVFGAELHGAELILEADAADLGALVFERAIDVAGLRFVAVGDFARDPDVGEVAGEEIADLGGQLGDGESAAVGHQVELKLAHWQS